MSVETTLPNLSCDDLAPAVTDARAEILQGLKEHPKRISPKYFYDERGSKLFERITELPEYYPTRTEIDILSEHCADIARDVGPRSLLVEFGSGSSAKVRILLNGVRPRMYMPLDISRDHLFAAAAEIATDFPWLQVHAACVDFMQPWTLPEVPHDLHRVGFFPGSSIGNFSPDQAEVFLRQVASTLGRGGGLIIGVDRKKDVGVLNRAYNDADGVTAAFNLNILRHVNHCLGSAIDPDNFEHLAFYNEARGRIEMHLRSRCNQTLSLAGDHLHLCAGELIHTENSHKYGRDEFTALAERSGFVVRDVWSDSREYFDICYLSC